MSCCGTPQTDADRKSAKIDAMLREEHKKTRREVKLLLLGPGDSGKSTLAKQVRILHMKGFTNEECMSYLPIIYSNLIFAVKQIIKATKAFGLPLQHASKKAARHLADNFFIFPEAERLGEDIGRDLLLVWSDAAIQSAYERRTEYNLMDSAEYFFQHLQRLITSDYTPHAQDILHARQRTRGIIETTYTVDKTPFRIVDVGGQRNERNKWVHCFEHVSAILFCVSLSEYNQTLEEDPTVNRMHESINLWEGICRYRWFVDTPFVLFLNKRDLLPRKLASVPLTVCFPAYKGPKKGESKTSKRGKDKSIRSSGATNGGSSSGSTTVLDSEAVAPQSDVEHAMEYIRGKFVERKVQSQRQVKVHFTCATDSQQTQVVLDAVYEHLLVQHLNEAALL